MSEETQAAETTETQEVVLTETQETVEQQGSVVATSTETSTSEEVNDEKFYEFLKTKHGIESLEQLESFKTFNPKEYIKPKSEIISKLNEWEGDPELFFKVSKLDVETLDNKEAIIQDKILKGYKREDAELLYEHEFGAADLKEDDDDYDPKKSRIALIMRNEAASTAKQGLAKWKTESMEQGKRTPNENTAQAEQEWKSSIKNTLSQVDKLESKVKFALPDKSEAEMDFNFGLDASSKSEVEKLLENPMNFFKKYSENGGFPKLVEAIAFLNNKDKVLSQAMTIAGQKALAEHLKTVRTGSIANPKTEAAEVATNFSQDKVVQQLHDQMFNRGK